MFPEEATWEYATCDYSDEALAADLAGAWNKSG